MHWTLACTLVAIGIAVVLGIAQWVTFQLGWGAGAGAAAIASVNNPPDPWWVELVRVAKRDRGEIQRG